MKKIIVSALLLVGLFSCTKDQAGHQCRWESCPYKGYAQFPGVINTGCILVDYSQEGTDTWAIDKLHFEYPDKDYDQLEDLLFNP